MSDTFELIDPKKMTESQKSGLARLYADEDIRSYLTHAIAIANSNVLSSLKSGKTEAATEYAIRLDTIKQLLDKGKLLYSQAERLKTTPLEDQIKDHENN